MAEWVKQDADDRQNDEKRKDREKRWKEVDMQLDMDPELIKALRAKRTDRGGDWVPEFVLPHQSTALEVLTSDSRRMLLPQTTNWFQCHADMTDDVLAKFEGANLLDVKDRQIGDSIDQEMLNTICEAWIQHNHRKYDVGRSVDLMLADALKYGECVGRVREVRGPIYSDDYRGVKKRNEKFVALAPSDMKQTYPDESAHNAMGEGLLIQPAWIRCYRQRIADIQLAAAKGNSNPRDFSAGGWMNSNVKALGKESRTTPTTEIIEYEGDLVVQRSRENIKLFNKVITVAVGKDVQVIRYRDQDMPFRSYIHGVYHYEGKQQKSSPLVKAAPILNAMSEMFNRLVAAGVINVEPPVSHHPDDPYFKAMGGPIVKPRANWPTITDPKVHQIGDPEKLLQVFMVLLRMYEELTGVTSPRTGHQTKSHQTAFAVDQEVSRSQVRTVDFVQSLLRGPWVNWLHMEWDILRRRTGKEKIWIPKLDAYINISGDMMPDNVVFEAFGAAGPIEEAREMQKKLQAVSMVVQMEELSQMLGGKPLDIDKVRTEVLQNGGWANPEALFGERSASPQGAVAPGQAVPGGTQTGQPIPFPAA